jgi:hypothetical protein
MKRGRGFGVGAKAPGLDRGQVDMARADLVIYIS